MTNENTSPYDICFGVLYGRTGKCSTCTNIWKADCKTKSSSSNDGKQLPSFYLQLSRYNGKRVTK